MVAKCLFLNNPLDRDGHLHAEWWKNSMGYRFVPECNHAQESHTCQFFRCFPAIFAGRRFVDATPWQRDVTTFSLYCTWMVPGA